MKGIDAVDPRALSQVGVSSEWAAGVNTGVQSGGPEAGATIEPTDQKKQKAGSSPHEKNSGLSMNLPQDTPGHCQNQPNGIWLSIAAMRNMGKSSPRLDDPGEDLPTSSKSSFALTPRPLRPHTLEVIAVMAVK